MVRRLHTCDSLETTLLSDVYSCTMLLPLHYLIVKMQISEFFGMGSFLNMTPTTDYYYSVHVLKYYADWL